MKKTITIFSNTDKHGTHVTLCATPEQVYQAMLTAVAHFETEPKCQRWHKKMLRNPPGTAGWSAAWSDFGQWAAEREDWYEITEQEVEFPDPRSVVPKLGDRVEHISGNGFGFVYAIRDGGGNDFCVLWQGSTQVYTGYKAEDLIVRNDYNPNALPR